MKAKAPSGRTLLELYELQIEVMQRNAELQITEMKRNTAVAERIAVALEARARKAGQT